LELTFDGLISSIDIAIQAAADEIPHLNSDGKTDGDLINRTIALQKERIDHVANIRASDVQGNLIYGQGILSPPVNISDRAHFRTQRDNPNAGLFIGDPIIGRTDQKWGWVFSRRINGLGGSLNGVIYASIPVENINKKFAQIKMNSGDLIALRNQTGKLIARYIYPDKFASPDEDNGLTKAFADALLLNPKEGSYLSGATNFDGTSRIHSYNHSEKYGFLISVGTTKEYAFAEWRKQAWAVGGLVFIFILLSLTLSKLISRAWVRKDQDITRLKLHKDELQQIAHYDTLTGVPNRHLLADRIEHAISRTRRSGKLLAVCYLDIDDFKPINDQHGHAFGDRVLVMITDQLKRAMREEDTLARLGGDEFVLLFTDIVHIDEVHIVLERLLTASNTPLQVDGIIVSVTASIGVSIFPTDDVDADTLIRHADQAMYQSKEAGKNNYHIFNPNQGRQLHEHRIYQQRLQKALENKEFVLHYQPKVDLISGEVIGAEALIRWQHPEKGLLSPATFLHYLNGIALESAVGEWVINSVLEQIATWHADGLSLVISANISADHLLHVDFADRLRLSLDRNPSVNPANLELEILETAALSDLIQAAKVLTRCREFGVQISIDDFGTGYSSLTYLRKLPVDTLKIDLSFVRDMLNDPEDLSIVLSVVQLARVFNRSVIAEGVETLEHGEKLVQLGCRLMQGYGIARPMPAKQIPGWIDQWKEKAVWLSL